MIYAIDFDGTIVEEKFPEIGKLKPEAAAFIRELRKRGDKWILNTMREGEYLTAALDFLAIHDLIPDAANDNLPEITEDWGNNPRKIFADIYIDDRNAGGLFFIPGQCKRLKDELIAFHRDCRRMRLMPCKTPGEFNFFFGWEKRIESLLDFYRHKRS